MNCFAKGALRALSIVALMSLPTVGQAASFKQTHDFKKDPNLCDNEAVRVRAVRLQLPDPPNPLFNTVDFSGSAKEPDGITLNGNGLFDPIPLLETKIFVEGKRSSCVIVHFSAQVKTGDNMVVFQASIDDDPMEGHGLFPVDIRAPQLIPPVVIDRGTVFSAQLPDLNVPTLASYNFFKIVKPGWHIVKIKWAGCCSFFPDSQSAAVLSAVMVIQYDND